MPELLNLPTNTYGTNGSKDGNTCNVVRPLKIGAPKMALINSLKTKIFRGCRKP